MSGTGLAKHLQIRVGKQQASDFGTPTRHHVNVSRIDKRVGKKYGMSSSKSGFAAAPLCGEHAQLKFHLDCSSYQSLASSLQLYLQEPYVLLIELLICTALIRNIAFFGIRLEALEGHH